jgi:hypothetical protein
VVATAYRVRVLRMGAGHDEEETVEAEAGGILDAETALEIHGLHVMVESYMEALNRAGGSA